MVRKRFVFRGTVQGVGFRPAVYRLAESLGLRGFVQNRRSEVVAEVQGETTRVREFGERLRGALPPAARLEQVMEFAVDAREEESGFRIDESGLDPYAFPPIPPDLPICGDCTHELLDPANRRYLYPFITCTQCGPRYSIVERTPFDRPHTTMRPFVPCARCAAEYADPSDRRFHSQTNSCANCGPVLTALDPRGRRIATDPVRTAIEALAAGGVVAVHGIGGFHLAADPRFPRAIERLRQDKDRERKPFALMVATVDEARRLCRLSADEERLLCPPVAPILIASRRPDAPFWTSAVSDTETLGVMLPYTPLHVLLFLHPDAPANRALVMTSGNRGGEPIITDPSEAVEMLSDTVDLFLCHDRRIAFRIDDSIVRTGPASPPVIIRRSRGYVPRLIPLRREVGGVRLALGGDLKNAPAFARGRDVHLCAFNGDLDSAASQAQFEREVRQLLELYDATPDVVVADLHPDYVSSRWTGPPTSRRVLVQHHHAHALSVMAEHGLEESLALCFDGTGYGTDGTTWGGEFLHAGRRGFKRLGSFSPFLLPGGDAAVRHTPRIAFALLGSAATGRIPGLTPSEETFLQAMMDARVNCPVTTSLGRIFDAAAAILGVVDRATYEGEGPIRLEGIGLSGEPRGAGAQSGGAPLDRMAFAGSPGDERQFLVDPRPLLASLLERRERSGIPQLAREFHEAVAAASAEGARMMRRLTGLSRIALCGGVFQNVLLRELLLPLLIKEGFEVLLNQQVPAGDGGLALGQAWFEDPQEGEAGCASPHQ